MGRFLTPKYRNDIFLMTKVPAKTGAGVRKMQDESLKALKTDYVDLWQIHAMGSPEDVDDRINAGVLDAFLEAKEKGRARYIGFTGHQNPVTHLHLLEFLDKWEFELDTCQMPLNVCDPSFESFEKLVFPGTPTVKDAYMFVNEAPGLGIDIDEEKAAKYPLRDYNYSWTRVRKPNGPPVRP